MIVSMTVSSLVKKPSGINDFTLTYL